AYFVSMYSSLMNLLRSPPTRFPYTTLFRSASGVFLGGEFYSVGFGAGSRFVIRPNPSTSLLAAVEYRHKDYDNSDTYPTAELRRSEEHTSELQSRENLVCRLLLEKKKQTHM